MRFGWCDGGGAWLRRGEVLLVWFLVLLEFDRTGVDSRRDHFSLSLSLSIFIFFFFDGRLLVVILISGIFV